MVVGLEAGGGSVWGYRDGGSGLAVMVAYLARGGSMGYGLLETAGHGWDLAMLFGSW